MTSKEVRMLWVQVMPAQVDIPSEAVFVRWAESPYIIYAVLHSAKKMKQSTPLKPSAAANLVASVLWSREHGKNWGEYDV